MLGLPLAALAAGASTLQVAVLVAATRAPYLVLGLPAGVWVNRVGLRRSMLLSDLLRAVALASLPLTALAGSISYGQLLGVALILGCGSVTFQVAYQSLTPLLVDDPALLRSANTWLSASEALAQIGGPALAGVLVGALGAAKALAVDAGSYLASIGSLAAISAPEHPSLGTRPSLVGEVKTGLRSVLETPVLRAVLFSSVIFNGAIAGYEALLVVFAIHHLGLSPATLGVAIGIGGVGVPLGLALAGPAEHRWGTGPVLIIGSVLSSAGLLVAGAAHSPASAVMISIGTFVTALGGGAWGVTALTVRQTLSRPELRAMTTAVHRWATYGILPVGALLAGLAATLGGPRAAILLAGAVGQLAVVPLLRSPVPQLRTLRFVSGM